MKKTPPAILIATAAAMAVSTAALVLATSPERRALGVAVAPFGWNRVIVTHALVTLPLAWTLAVGLCGVAPAICARWTAAVWIAAGAGLAYLAVAGGGFIAHAMDVFQAGYAGRMTLRVAWCVLLEVPWCLAGLAIASRPTWLPTRTLLNCLAWSLVVAVVIPISFVNAMVDRQTALARDYWQTLRIDRARRVVRQLRELGSARSLAQVTQLRGSVCW